MQNVGVWAKELDGQMNANALFLMRIDSETDGAILAQIAAVDVFKVWINGNSVFWGPARAAHGYATLHRLRLPLKKGDNTLAIVVSSYLAANYSCAKQAPFFYFRAQQGNREITARDFLCYRYAERLQKVQRYSFQRGFSENYIMETDFAQSLENYLTGGTPLSVVERPTPTLLDEIFSLPLLDRVSSAALLSRGTFALDETLEPWKNRSIDLVGNCFDGYPKDELVECVSDAVSRFVYREMPGASNVLHAGEYALYRFARNLSGLLRLRVTVRERAVVYATYEEIPATDRPGVDPFRIGCCNAVKWELAPGSYTLETMEPYTARLVQLYLWQGELTVHSVDTVRIENPNAYNLSFAAKDADLTAIVAAAQHTLAQNSYDVLIDCPSRERACWINDFYYTHQSAELCFGSTDATRASLLPTLLGKGLSQLPEGMLPMVYPGDHLDGNYIPLCAMWYLFTLCNLLDRGQMAEYRARAKEKAYGVLRCFRAYENEDGLLENLGGWIFVEWSAAGSRAFVSGVNYPSNMLYYKTLCAVGTTFKDAALLEKAARVKEAILAQSFDGTFFQDNRIRVDGKLTLQGHISETCQYYAYFSGVATKEQFPEHFRLLIERFGPFRNRAQLYPEIDASNIIVGLLMRLDLLNEAGEYRRVIDETKAIFGCMAEGTQTLWENTTAKASCNHGIASYVIRPLLRAMIGLDGPTSEGLSLSDCFCADVDCEVRLPIDGRSVTVTVANGVRTVKD